MRRTFTSRGFTLIELLVVIGIIFVLASILFPVVSAINRNSKAAVCASNERQLVAAILSYTASNDGVLPAPAVCWGTSSWGVADFNSGYLMPTLAPSVEARAQILHCPADTLEQLCSVGADIPQPPARNFSYSLNINIAYAPPGGTVGIRLQQVKNPSAHVMVYEEFAPNDVYCYGPTDGDDWLTGRHGGPGTIEHRAAYQNSNWRMDGRGNVGYFDGHVAIMSVNTYFNSTYHFGPLNQ
ncbi:MAG TPA: type II secretion system protein [Tepidisphaeraceae bacterium]|jgi:prepilin-type N-terminal cleavage/methylation domain-containing protein/prepilin-type processing-associated H-X9-DG protein|nr:type II secretion system protein [Tepidisphaeraceae bacterium]